MVISSRHLALLLEHRPPDEGMVVLLKIDEWKRWASGRIHDDWWEALLSSAGSDGEHWIGLPSVTSSALR